MPRPLDGKATIGAREYLVPAGIGAVVRDSGDDSSIQAEYFDLMGRHVANPSKGIYILRRGAYAEKVMVK